MAITTNDPRRFNGYCVEALIAPAITDAARLLRRAAKLSEQGDYNIAISEIHAALARLEGLFR